MVMRDFTSAPRPGDAAVPAKLEFRLDGEPFRVELRMDGDAVLEWSELAATAADNEDDLTSAAGVAFTSRFFRLMMPPETYAAFRAHMRRHRTSPEVLAEIMQVINEEMEKLVARQAARPTGPPSSSSRGRGARGGRTSQIISLPGGDVEWADSPPARQRRRGQQRRRAG